MLSYLYRLATQFESRHGHCANIIYLNPSHFQQLKVDLDAIQGLDELVQFLGMEIVIENGISHPHLAHSMIDWRVAAAV